MFDEITAQKLKYYVYALIDPRGGKPFYVGKGIDNRVFQHVEDALETESITDKLDTIREIRCENKRVEHVIIRHGLTSDQAFRIESAIIDLLDHIKINLKNDVSGHHSMEFGIMTANELMRLYNAPLLKEIKHNLVIININKKYEKAKGKLSIYDAVKHCWNIKDEKTKELEYVLAEFRKVIVGVFKVHRWYQVDLVKGGKTEKRWAFDGEEAESEIQDLYFNKSIYKKRGAQNPIRYNLYFPGE